MRYEITRPDGKRFEVNAPDGATEQEVMAYAQKQFAPVQPHVPVNPTDDMGFGQNVMAGIGKGMVDLGRGAGQMLGLTSQQEVDEARRVDAPLMDTAGGITGNIIGSVVPAAAAMFVPGANTVAGSGVMGAALSALQPTAQGESRLQNAALGGVVGAGAQAALGKLAKVAGDKLAAKEAAAATAKAQNAVRDATLAESQAAGYAVPPSLSGGGWLARAMEGVSGKAKTNQAMAIKNQNVTDKLARQALNLSDDAPLTPQTMQYVRNEAFKKGYEPLANAGAIETDRVFQKSLDALVKDYQGASRSFPGAVKNDVMQRVDSLRTGVMDVGDALAMTRILRDEASAAYRAGDNALGKATKGASKAIEDQIERALGAAGKDGAELLKNFRDARQLMAKAHSVEDALVAGGGQVNAKVLGAALQRGKPLSGELKTIGAFANNFKDVAGVPQSGWANPVTALDAFGAAGMAGMDAGLFSIAPAAARLGSRQALLNMKHTPQYGPGMLNRLTPQMLEELEKRGFGGLLGSANARQ